MHVCPHMRPAASQWLALTATAKSTCPDTWYDPWDTHIRAFTLILGCTSCIASPEITYSLRLLGIRDSFEIVRCCCCGSRPCQGDPAGALVQGSSKTRPVCAEAEALSLYTQKRVPAIYSGQAKAAATQLLQAQDA